MIEHGIEGTMPRKAVDIRRVERVLEALGQKDKLIKEVRNHLNLNPKPHSNRVRVPHILDRFLHTRTQQPKPTMRFMTTDRNVPPWPCGDILDEENPFTIYRNKEVDIFGNIFKTGDKSKNVCAMPMKCDDGCKCKVPSEMCSPKKNVKALVHIEPKSKPRQQTMNGCIVNEKLTRLQTPVFNNPPSKIELEPNYFDCMKGRPLKENFKRSDFNKMQRLVFFQSLYMGYFQDDIKRHQEHCNLDMWQLADIHKDLDRTKKNYEAFITEAHSDSVGLVKEQIAMEHVRQDSTLELNKAKGAMTGLKSNIYKRYYKLSEVLLCRDLLLKLSPQTFRASYRTLVADNKKRELLKEEVLKLYTDYCRYNPEEANDFFLDEAIHNLLENIRTLGPPRIYFKHKWELDMVLRRMELDCVACVSDLMRIDDMNAEVVKLSKQVTKFFHLEKRMMQSEMSTGEAIFCEEKLRSNILTEATNNEINTFYKEVAIGDHLLETIGLVEVLHQDIFGPSKQKFDVMEMINQIEGMLHRMERSISLIPPNRYHHYERKVNRRLARERTEPFIARRKYTESKSYIKRVTGMYEKPPIGYRWRRVLPRSAMPPARHRKRKTTVPRGSVIKINHLQLNKICTRDDLEEDIDFILKCHVRMKPKGVLDGGEGRYEDSYKMHSSLRSSVDTETIEEIMGSDKGDDDIDARSSFEILELGFDSDEMLIRENFKKRQEKGLVGEEPRNLYDVRSIDNRFLVKSVVGGESTAEKDKRHSHRPEKRPNFNSLSWR